MNGWFSPRASDGFSGASVMLVSTATAGPDDTTKVIGVPGGTEEPMAGTVRITEPKGTVLLASITVGPTTKPAATIAACASASVRPLTSGISTGVGPNDTTRSTDDPGGTIVPSTGADRITCPAGTLA